MFLAKISERYGNSFFHLQLRWHGFFVTSNKNFKKKTRIFNDFFFLTFNVNLVGDIEALRRFFINLSKKKTTTTTAKKPKSKKSELENKIKMFKVGLPLSKKIKQAFYFILKTLFVLKIFKFLS